MYIKSDGFHLHCKRELLDGEVTHWALVELP
jgi:hypothetical protein